MNRPDPINEPVDPEAIFDDFLYALDGASDPAAVKSEWLAVYPFLGEKYQQFEMMEAPLRVPADPARRVLGRYAIRRQLPHQGMGVVYVGFDPDLKRQVIIKTFPESGSDESLRLLFERFNRERRVLAQLHHTHIVPIYDAGRDGRLLFCVMPYIRGASLHEIIFATLESIMIRHAEPRSIAATAHSLALHEIQRVSPPPQSTVVERDSGAPGVIGFESRPITLPMSYIRSAVQVILEAARAVHHAHTQQVFEHFEGDSFVKEPLVRMGVLHRDIKPANILIEPGELPGQAPHVWLIDLGLARFLDSARIESGLISNLRPDGDRPVTIQVGTLVGTPNYMAPEQYDGVADVRSDVWGLGATLYEVLTLRMAFPGTEKLEATIRTHDPVSPRKLVPNLPRDLEAICMKCLQRNPNNRFASANELSDDLRRWLDGEPTRARGAFPLRRCWMWVRRHPAASIALLVTFLLLAGGTVVGFDQAQSRRRDLLLLAAQNELLRPHSLGWSQRLQSRVRDFPRGGRIAALRDLSVGSLRDLDATSRMRLGGVDSAAVAFDATGERIVTVGILFPADGTAGTTATVFNVANGQILFRSQPNGTGPVAFEKDGHPILVHWDPKDRLAVIVWDVEKGQERTRRWVADGMLLEPWDQDRPAALALADDGSAFAAGTVLPNGKSIIRVWDTTSGNLIQEIPSPATALALSSGGTKLAVGDADGQLTVWSLPSGERKVMANARRAGVNCLALHASSAHHSKDRPGEQHWLLAAGHAGGAATVWDVDRGALLAQCAGAEFDQTGIAFSPDGTTLATASRDPAVRLWDSLTGRPLLTLPGATTLTSIAFSPDGRSLSTGSTRAMAHDAACEVFDIENGRGLTTLRGLSTPIVATRLSPDRRRVAALSHDWQIAVWDFATGRLEHLFDAPPGVLADNADLVFSPDGLRLAFASHRRAVEWDLKSGTVLRETNLNPGLADRLCYRATAEGEPRLLHFHSQTRDGRLTPFSEVPWREQPRIGVLSELLASAEPKLILEIPDFGRRIDDAGFSPDGAILVVHGRGGPEGTDHAAIAFSISDRKRIWTVPTEISAGVAANFDGSGQAVNVGNRDGGGVIVDPRTGRELAQLKVSPTCFHWPSGYGTTAKMPNRPGWSFHRITDSEPLVTFGSQIAPSGVTPIFDPTGNFIILGQIDGSVTVVNISRVRHELRELHLDW